MARDPVGKKPGKDRPDIWASGGQRPPFDIRALGRASLHLSRETVAPLHAWAARKLRQGAEGVRDGKGRIPAGKLGRAERLVPSHLRVASWVKNLAATLSHASATADPDVKRGNALVAEIEPHLWGEPIPHPAEPAPPPGEVGPVVLPEPKVLQPGEDPLASIRDEIANGPAHDRPAGPDTPPAPPGPVAEGAIQVSGYLIGWASILLALPVTLAWALWLWISGRDLRQIGTED
ncbi:MAG TPA: hypothetical protein VI412_02885 [Tabrizicola sp.]